MPYFSRSFVWLYNICFARMYVMFLLTYELHISLLVVGWGERRHNVFCHIPKILHILREERRHNTIVALERIQKYHILRDLRGSYKRNSEFYFENLAKL
jgi:hypothetical protein